MKEKKQKEKKIKPKLTKAERRKKAIDGVLYWTVLNIGVLLLAAGVLLFKSPNNFATGGVSGISIIIAKYTRGTFFTQPVINFIINGVLLIIGFIFLGKGCTFKTAYCSLMYTIEMYAFEQIFKVTGVELPLTSDKFMEFVYAMLLTSIAAAILFYCRASSGGTDIIALIVKKYAKMNIGVALFVSDFLIAASTFVIFDVTTGLYSILGLLFKSVLVDYITDGMGRTKFVTIITSHPEALSEFILDGMHRGVTTYKAVGGYTGEEKTVIITVCKRREAVKLKMQINRADPTAFVIVTNSNEIIGKGFRSSL
ncbi:MAG: YitT family protein [Clostridia bacterium]|nr:YitT family protein [Clostridia bacterium]